MFSGADGQLSPVGRLPPVKVEAAIAAQMMLFSKGDLTIVMQKIVHIH